MELPIIVPEMKGSYVVKYEFDGKRKICIHCSLTEMEIIYTMEQIPDDCDFYKIAIDETRQSKKEKIRCR